MIQIIEFDKPMTLTGNIYTYDNTKVETILETHCKIYIKDIRKEKENIYFNHIEDRKLIGNCRLIKTKTGVYADNIKSNINISNLIIYPATIGTIYNNKVKGQIEFVYISIEEDVTKWIRESQLGNLLN